MMQVFDEDIAVREIQFSCEKARISEIMVCLGNYWWCDIVEELKYWMKIERCTGEFKEEPQYYGNLLLF